MKSSAPARNASTAAACVAAAPRTTTFARGKAAFIAAIAARELSATCTTSRTRSRPGSSPRGAAVMTRQRSPNALASAAACSPRRASPSMKASFAQPVPIGSSSRGCGRVGGPQPVDVPNALDAALKPLRGTAPETPSQGRCLRRWRAETRPRRGGELRMSRNEESIGAETETSWLTPPLAGCGSRQTVRGVREGHMKGPLVPPQRRPSTARGPSC